GRFDDDIGAHLVPLQVGRVALLGQADAVAVDHQGVAVDRHVALEAAAHGVVAQHVGQVVRLEQVVDGDDLDVTEILDRRTQDVAADAAEPVDAYLDCHGARTPGNRVGGQADSLAVRAVPPPPPPAPAPGGGGGMLRIQVGPPPAPPPRRHTPPAPPP